MESSRVPGHRRYHSLTGPDEPHRGPYPCPWAKEPHSLRHMDLGPTLQGVSWKVPLSPPLLGLASSPEWTPDPCYSIVSSPVCVLVSCGSWLGSLGGPWSRCITFCLSWDYPWTLLPAPTSAHSGQMLWDCASVRALQVLGSPLAPLLWKGSGSSCCLTQSS